ncbi:MAG TPA: WD40 repeat domain-containing protein [Xanthobacteraceae bacterium]|nr:WD40 repeat domain-containing protein [Xanthobacteraceae bacterium]
MADKSGDTPSVVGRTRPFATGGGIVAAHFLGRTATFVLGDEAIVLASPDGEARRVAVHDGAILASAADGARIVSGGDDGKIVATDANGQTRVLATDPKHRWVDHIALGPDGAIAWSAGKNAFARGKELRTFEAPSTVGGLAFFPKGFRLAIAHYNGATLWFPNASGAAPVKLEWKGSHLGATVSPDGCFLVTTMQEPMLHGWRLADGQHMRMSGYTARVMSLSWSAGGQWLATAGAAQLVLWPFQSKDGPMGKTPRLLTPSGHRIDVVACRPRNAIVAAGYGNGLVLLARIDDGAEILAKNPGDAPVSALAWSADGQLLAWGTEAGEAGIIDLA